MELAINLNVKKEIYLLVDKKILLHALRKISTLVSFLLTGVLYSQNINFEYALSFYDNEKFKESLEELKKIDTAAISEYDKATWYYYYADIQFSLDKHDVAYQFALKAEDLYEALEERSDVIDSKLLRLSIVSHQNSLNFDEKLLINDILSYIETTNDSTTLMKVYFRIGNTFTRNNNHEKANYYYRIILEKTKKSIDTAHAYMNIGTVYSTIAPQNQDSALSYAKKAIPILVKNNNLTSLASNYNNQAEAYYYKKQYKKAIEYLLKADSITLNKNDKKTRIIFYENLAKNYDSLSDYRNASYYYSKKIKLTDSINNLVQNLNIADVREKYKTADLKAKNAQTNTYLTISLAILTLVIISAYLLQKNTRKKQLLAEQAKDLEEQKVSTLLKEQELASIDAMIEGQEKERKRIAEDLHDDLGALMATINLHLENVGSKNSPNALKKTKSLLGEAYTKIRSIAHAKNAGVIANQGLLVAINNMASKIKSANKLDIEVIAHGLENRLENSLELSLFRMIQELIANIIKHAEATKATIQLTQFENSLNIIVEDNGKGFETTINKEVEKKGIGLESIKKRIIHLEGTFSIDSTIGKGTTILIDIPLTV